jgi:hypothetical protein
MKGIVVATDLSKFYHIILAEGEYFDVTLPLFH